VRRTSVLPQAKPWRKGEFTSPAQIKSNGVPIGPDRWGADDRSGHRRPGVSVRAVVSSADGPKRGRGQGHKARTPARDGGKPRVANRRSVITDRVSESHKPSNSGGKFPPLFCVISSSWGPARSSDGGHESGRRFFISIASFLSFRKRSPPGF